MPAYNIATPFSLSPGHSNTVWSNELIVVSAKSQQVALTRDLNNVLSVEIKFAADPGVFQIDLQTADTDADAYYVTKATINSGLNAAFVGRIEATNIVARYARLVMVAKANAVNVTAGIF